MPYFKNTKTQILLCSLAACGGPGSGGEVNADGEKVFHLRLAHNLAEDHAVHIAMTAWAEAVEEKSNGSISIQIFPNGTLGSETDCITIMRAGGLDMTKVSAATLGNFKNEWNALSVPYVFNDKEHYYNVMDGEIAHVLHQRTAHDKDQQLLLPGPISVEEEDQGHKGQAYP